MAARPARAGRLSVVERKPPAEVTVGAAIAHGWDRLKRFFWPLVGLTALVWLLQLPATDSLRESWRRTRGHLGTLFVFWLAAVGIAVVGFLLLVVGIIPASALILVAIAGL